MVVLHILETGEARHMKAHSDSIEFIRVIQKTLMHVCMYVSIKFGTQIDRG